MSHSKHTLTLILVMVSVAFVGAAIWAWALYNAAIREQASWLLKLAQSQARIVESVAQYDFDPARENYSQTPRDAVLSQIESAHHNYSEFGKSGEFVWARQEGDQIVFLFKRRFSAPDDPKAIPFSSHLAVPMQNALMRRSGTLIGPDYRNATVLAAYEPVKGLDIGVVAKIDMSEIQEPFIRVGFWGVLSSLFIITVGGLLTQRINAPVISDLNEAKEQAIKANSAKSEFLASMSHDLRTPLNAILGFSDMMRTQVFGPLGNAHYEDYVNDIHHSGKLLVSLINDVLDLSKIEAGKYVLEEQDLDLSCVIEVSVKQLMKMAEASSQSISVHVPTDMPPLRGDERALIQVLNNLLSNAIKFTPDGGKIDLTAQVDDEDKIVLTVCDTGIGMSQENIVKALEPFEQADGTHSRRHEGTGLGLHLCYNFMKLFGGTLEIESEVGVRTAVSLYFPPERTVRRPSAAT